MSKTPRYTLFQAVLDWCNSIRTAKNLEPLDYLPKGVKTDGYSCPCGKATGVFVGCSGWADTKEDYDSYPRIGHPNTDAVAEFVERFDNGEFPELIQNGENNS